MPLTLAVVCFFFAQRLAVSHEDPALSEEGPIQGFIAHAQQRERELGDQFFVEFRIMETINPLSLQRHHSDTRADVQELAAELTLKRTVSLAWMNGEWRLESRGQHLVRDRPDGAFRTSDRTVIHVHRRSLVQEYTAPEDAHVAPRGQVHTSNLANDGDGYLNDIATLPITLFVRPANAFIFQEIVNGRFLVRADAQEPFISDSICADGVRVRARICFRPDARFVPTSLKVRDAFELSIEYAAFDGFGVAPKGWACNQRMAGDRIGRFWTATVHRWHRNAAEIAGLIDFRYPGGTEVTDLDHSLRLVAGTDGSLTPRPTDAVPARLAEPGMSWMFVIAVNVAALGVMVLVYMCVRRGMRALHKR